MRHANEINIGRDYFRNQYLFMTSIEMKILLDVIYFNKPIRRRDYVYRDIKRCA
jgi:hypothetical protein